MASLHFYHAAMNSGKTTQLLQSHFNYSERGMNPYAMTPRIDDRVKVGLIAARIGLHAEADTFTDTCNLFDIVKEKHEKEKIHAFFIEEAQFLKRHQVYECARIVDELGIPVLAYGLKTDFKGELFEGSYNLLCLANKIYEIKTICWCGRKAQFNARIDGNGNIVKDGEQIEIGGNDRYTSLCRKHYLNNQSSRPNKNN